jgi:hypothetical protein
MKDAAVEKLGANYSLSITAMAPRDYVAQGSTKGKKVTFYEMLNPCFLKIASNQICIFLMAGNDSTCGTVIHAYHLSSQYRDILLKLLHDHTEVFGASTAL